MVRRPNIFPTRRLKMFPPRQNESNFLFGLRWSARLLSAVSIGLILLFIFGEGLDVSIIAWEEMGVLMLFPLGFLIGLLLGWQEELKGGALAVGSIAAFYFVYRLILNGSILQGWWFAIVALPGFLFLLYGIFLSASRGKGRIAHK